jgi:hypothetical protein
MPLIGYILDHPEMSDREAAIEEKALPRGPVVLSIQHQEEMVDTQGNVLGFSVQKVSAIRTQPLDIAL